MKCGNCHSTNTAKKIQALKVIVGEVVSLPVVASEPIKIGIAPAMEPTSVLNQVLRFIGV